MTKLWKFAVVAALVLGVFAALSAVLAPGEVAVPRVSQCAVYTEQGCAKYVVASGGELEVQSGGTLDMQSGSTITQNATLEMNNNTIVNIGNAGTDFSTDGGLTTAGGITITTGGLVASAGGISATGASTVNGGLTVNGDITLENGETISNSTDGDVFVNGALLGYTNIVSKSANYTLLAVESGSLCTNFGAANGLTYTLPAAVAGLHYCFYVAPSQIITLAVQATDQIHHLTNAAGDRVNNGTAGDSLCLTAIDEVYWIPTQEGGTWSDTN